MPTRVKICGITNWGDAQLAVDLGAAALGFNFYPPSPRYVEPSVAQSIIFRLPPLVLPVGVFADETDGESVGRRAREALVKAVQLHGPQFPRMDGAIAGFTLIRAVAVTDEFRPETLRGLHADAYLLDTFDPDLRGGTGRKFTWALACDAHRFGTIVLAGGLTSENVGQAIREVRPFAVDVAGGVESAPGKKDPEKMRAFFAAVAEADKTAGD